MKRTWDAQPEPGSKVKDKSGLIWTRQPGGSMWADDETRSFRLTWLSLLDGYAPLTEVEPAYYVQVRCDGEFSSRVRTDSLQEAARIIRMKYLEIMRDSGIKVVAYVYHDSLIDNYLCLINNGNEFLWSIKAVNE